MRDRPSAGGRQKEKAPSQEDHFTRTLSREEREDSMSMDAENEKGTGEQAGDRQVATTSATMEETG